MGTPLKLPVRVEKVIRHTDSVKSFHLVPLKKCPRFRPGQFLHFALDPFEPGSFWPESRVFSIANSPTRAQRLGITFALKGDFTTRMYNEVREGDIRWIKLPFGHFFLQEDASEVVLIAGGTGIVPFLSYLEYAIDKGLQNRISLLYGVRSRDYYTMGSFLDDCHEKLHDFVSILFVEDGMAPEFCKEVTEGIISLESIFEQRSGLPGAVFYLSGPNTMIRDMRIALETRGVGPENIRVDEWE